MRRVIAVLIVVLCAAANAAVAPALILDEVETLLSDVQASTCEFSRKGGWYSGAEASAQFRQRFEAVQGKVSLRSAEQFIDIAATADGPTESPLLVRCGASEPETGEKWLTSELAVVRATMLQERESALHRKSLLREAFSVVMAVIAYGGVFPLLAGGLLLIKGGRVMANYQNTSTWPKVPAVVLHSLLRERSNGDGTSFDVEICCAYEIDGHGYKTSRHTAGIGSYSHANANRAVMETYPSGKEVAVSVDPLNPANAILDTGYPQEMKQEQRFGLWMFLLGAALCLYAAMTGLPT